MSNPTFLTWSSSGATDTGKQRKHNEDSLLLLPELGLWVVADGMGGHEAGDVASQLVVRALQDIGEPRDLADFARQVMTRLQEANQQLRYMAEHQYGGGTVGTTVAALLAHGSQCATLWVGDSRVYRCRAGVTEQLTRDHTLAEEQIEKGLATPEEANANPYFKMLTRAVGAADQLQIGVNIEPMQDGDSYLLCSDGLNKELTDEEIGVALARGSDGTLPDELVELALQRGGRDNITVAVVRVTKVVL